MQKTKKISEKWLEKQLFDEIKKRKGVCRKFFSNSDTGWPDRDVFLPGGRHYAVELKTTGKTPDPIQVSKHRWLRSNGFSVWVIDSKETLFEFLKHIDSDL